MDLATIPHVPICRTGTYQLESGEVHFTAEHLTAAASAFANDPAVLAPRIRVQLEDQAHLDQEGIVVEASGGQGGPALGWVDNLVTEGDPAHTLYGDLHVPEEVAAVAQWAFPGRSIEGLFGWTTATGHTHDFVATGLLLLGTDWPGVTTLPDFRELESEFATEVLAAGMADTPVMVVAPEGAAIAARMESTPRAGQPMLDRVAQAGLSVFDLETQWYGAERDGELTDLPESYDFWEWYVSEVRADDDGTLYVVIFDYGTGDQWRFDVTGIDGQSATFGPPQPGGMDWRGATAAAMASAAPWTRTPRPALARWTNRPTKTPGSARASHPAPNSGNNAPMEDDQRRALALSLGMAEDTSEADLHTEAARRAAETQPSEEGEPTPKPNEGGDETESTPEGEPQPATASGRTVTLDREVWEQTQRDARDGATARAQQISAERDALIQAALDDGRIAPASAGLQRNADGSLPEGGWRRLLDEEPQATAAALAMLEPGKYPGSTRASGVTNRTGNSLARVRASFPELRSRQEVKVDG